MSAPAIRSRTGTMDHTEPFPDEELDSFHSPEPWTAEGRYIRDASGAIVVRGRSYADARRIAAAINATRDIPTDALERWLVQDVSDPRTRPDLEVDLDSTDPGPSPYLVTPYDRRRTDRRQNERRAPFTGSIPEGLLFDRRVMDRRLGPRRRSLADTTR
ncbi:MAG TPA: hypothetical protein VGH97_10565 [Thermoanaerobaculia bacterium]